MIQAKMRAQSEHGASVTRRAVFAGTIVLAPLALFVGTIFNPAAGLGSGAANIAANAAANGFTNGVHVAAFDLLAFVLPVSVLGLAQLALERSPWLATIGGGLGLLGWLPFSALAAQDELTRQMAQLGADPQMAMLWDRFTHGGTMLVFLLVYIVAHLIAYVLLPIALRRAGVIPTWAAWTLALSSPLTIVAFASRQHLLLLAVCALLFAGSLPAAAALLSAPERAD